VKPSFVRDRDPPLRIPKGLSDHREVERGVVSDKLRFVVGVDEGLKLVRF
jgi:hypothetical protein